jgi:uncharacterized cofD-like protein
VIGADGGTVGQGTGEASAAGVRVGHIVALGGGHGLATTLSALREHAHRLTAVVSVADDGGSSGRLRAMTGMPAPGDLRRCLVAMADAESLWAQAFEHRFVGGDLDGHALGNLVIAGLAETTGDFASALDAAADLLGVTGRVLPATAGPVVLKADVGGVEVLGQVNVAGSGGPISAVCVVPADSPSPPEVVEAVATADLVVIGPGSLFTSVLATCVVPDVRTALAGRSGGRVYVCNLRPQLPETAGYQSADHLRAVLSHGVPIDVVVVDKGFVGSDEAYLRGVADAAGIRVVIADLARPDRSAHDPHRLGAMLAALAPR